MKNLRDIRAFLLDMDGTIYVSDEIISRAREFIRFLEEKGYPFLFLTNNSAARAEDYQKKLSRMGIEVEKERVLTSGEATIRYLLRETPHRKICLLGTPALENEFRDHGLVLDNEEPHCVVLGFDMTLTFEKLANAGLLLAKGVPYYATHPDFTCITDRGLIPDTGAIIAALDTVVHRKPKIIGKPQPEMVAAALEKLGAAAGETAMVGDQLDTDLTMAAKSNLFGVLVLSGETPAEKLESQSLIKPDMVVSDVGELCDRLREL